MRWMTWRATSARPSLEEVVANALAAIDGAAEVIPRKWANIQSIYMKTNESVALPIYNAIPDNSDGPAPKEVKEVVKVPEDILGQPLKKKAKKATK